MHVQLVLVKKFLDLNFLHLVPRPRLSFPVLLIQVVEPSQYISIYILKKFFDILNHKAKYLICQICHKIIHIIL
jgi:hypothetical protein